MSTDSGTDRQLLRHALATVAYRGAKPLRDAPADFGTLAIPNYPRPPIKILSHINDLFDWSLSISKGQTVWNDSVPNDWTSEVARFFRSIKALDDYLGGPIVGNGIVPDGLALGDGEGPIEEVVDVGENFDGRARVVGDGQGTEISRGVAERFGAAVGDGGQGVAEELAVGARVCGHGGLPGGGAQRNCCRANRKPQCEGRLEWSG